jgi:pimeloyl-ACP methyl ester carboxylesterase
MVSRLDWSRDGKDWPNRAVSSFVQAAGLRWHVQRMGSGPSLVFVHGTASSVHTWAGIAPELAKSFSLTMFDLPGHGFSAATRADEMSLENIASRAADLLLALDVKPDILIGHSAGASIAAQMVCDQRVARPRGIISINGALRPFSGAAGADICVARRRGGRDRTRHQGNRVAHRRHGSAVLSNAVFMRNARAGGSRYDGALGSRGPRSTYAQSRSAVPSRHLQ